MKGRHKVADGRDGISSPNPELCQRQRLAIYQHASLLVHNPRNSGYRSAAVPAKTPLLFAGPFICKSLASGISGRVSFVIIITDATTKSIPRQSDYLKRTRFQLSRFFFFISHYIFIYLYIIITIISSRTNCTVRDSIRIFFRLRLFVFFFLLILKFTLNFVQTNYNRYEADLYSRGWRLLY